MKQKTTDVLEGLSADDDEYSIGGWSGIKHAEGLVVETNFDTQSCDNIAWIQRTALLLHSQSPKKKKEFSRVTQTTKARGRTTAAVTFVCLAKL
jgi:hypothetical protein